MKILLDGCSMTWGLNLDPKDRLEHLLTTEAGHTVTNNSRPGKSNLAMSMDIYNSAEDHDLILVGWSYTSRFYLKYKNYDIDFMPTVSVLDLPIERDSGLLNDAYNNFHKYFYTMFENKFASNFSDMLVNQTYTWCKYQGKKCVFFSWDHRISDFDIYYPYIPPHHKLPCGHLNQAGTRQLFTNLKELINES